MLQRRSPGSATSGLPSAPAIRPRRRYRLACPETWKLPFLPARHTCDAARRCWGEPRPPSGSLAARSAVTARSMVARSVPEVTRVMAGAMRKMAVYLGLVEDEEDQYDEVEAEQRPEPQLVRRYAADDPRVERPTVVRRASRNAEPHRGGAPTVAPVRPSYRITTVQPRTYNEARQIG